MSSTSALLVLAGVGGGLTGSIAGLASLISYPALLSVGLPPVAANVTNTVAVVASSIGSAAGSLPQLRGQRARLPRLGTASATAGPTGALAVHLARSCRRGYGAWPAPS